MINRISKLNSCSHATIIFFPLIHFDSENPSKIEQVMPFIVKITQQFGIFILFMISTINIQRIDSKTIYSDRKTYYI